MTLVHCRRSKKDGVIQWSGYTFNLMWKTMKDFLEAGRLLISPVTPRHVTKKAFSAKLLADGQAWTDRLGHRNLLSHTYDFLVLEKAVDAIADRYLPAMESLHAYLIAQTLQ